MREVLRVEADGLGQLELQYSPASMTLTHDDGREESHTLRLFSLPDTVGGLDFFEYAADLLDQWAGEAEAEGDPSLRELQLLAWLDAMLPNPDRRSLRPFDATTLDRCESLRELTTATRTQGAPLPTRLLALAGGGGPAPAALSEMARYNRPLIRLPICWEEYDDFRRQLMTDLCEFKAAYETAIDEALSAPIRVKGKRLTKKQHREVVGKLGPDFWNCMGQMASKALGKIMDTAMEMEAESAARYKDVVERINALQIAVEAEINRRDVTWYAEAEDETTVISADAEAVIRDVLSVEEADDLLDALLRRVEQHNDLTPLEVVDPADFPAWDDEPLDEEAVELPEEPQFSVYEEYQQSLTLALADDDLLAKWSVLCELKAQLVDRRECTRLFRREIEGATAQMLGQAVELVYRAVRPSLTPMERRAFRLMYLPSRWLDGRIVAIDPLIWSFVTDLDDETREMIVSLFLTRHADASQRAELERRWNAFLRFYPHWLDAVRDDEREAARRRRQRTALLPENDHGVSVRQAGMAEPFAAVCGNVSEWAGRHCTPTQAKYLIARFRDGESEAEIGRRYGVTQQAVNNAIREGISRLRLGLREFDPQLID